MLEGERQQEEGPYGGTRVLRHQPNAAQTLDSDLGEASPRCSPLRVILECYLIIYGTPGTSQFPHALLPTRVGGDVGVGGGFRITASLL